MKPAGFALLLISFSSLSFAGDLQITVEKRSGNEAPKKTEGHAGQAEVIKKQDISRFSVTVSNDSFKPTNPLNAKYIIYVQRAQLGEKKGLERTEQIKGTSPLTPIASHASTTFNTSDVKLQEQALLGEWHYMNGGKISAKDGIAGIWVKVFDGTQEVADFANPPTLKNHHKWEE